MKKTILFAALAMAVLTGGAVSRSAERVIEPAEGAAQPATRFSSNYTSLTTGCGSGMTRKEEREAEKQGTDLPTVCRGLAGYVVDIGYSACSSNITVRKGDTVISFGMQELNYKQKTVEWRLANGKPFAVIIRTYEYEGNDLCSTNGKVTGESLIVKGLAGYEQIDEEIKVKGTPNPNVKARDLADKGFAKPKA